MSEYPGCSVLGSVAVGDQNFVRLQISGGHVPQRVRVALWKKIERLLRHSGPLDVEKELATDRVGMGGEEEADTGAGGP